MTVASRRLLPGTNARRDVRRVATMSGLRLAAGVCQFSTVLYITGYLSLRELGDYSMFVIVLGYFTQLTGFNFSTFVIREIAAHKRDAWPSLLLQQLRFLTVSYVIVLGAGVLAAAVGAVPSGYLLAFAAILWLSVVNSAFENYMIGAAQPVPAALNVLLRAAWILPLALGSSLGWLSPSLSTVFGVWFAGELLAATALLVQMRYRRLTPSRIDPVDRAWIARGVRVSAGYTVLAVLLLVTISVQRVVLGRFHPNDLVGIFHFYFVISVFLPNLLEASVFALLLPRLIARHIADGSGRLRAPDPLVFVYLAGPSIAGLLAVAAVLPYLLPLLGKEALIEHRYLLAFTAPYAVLYSCARVFHHQLYSAHRDRALLVSCAVACLVACGSSLALIPGYGLTGAAVALLLAGIALVSCYAAPFALPSVRRARPAGPSA